MVKKLTQGSIVVAVVLSKRQSSILLVKFFSRALDFYHLPLDCFVSPGSS